jgi:putative membrane protein
MGDPPVQIAALGRGSPRRAVAIILGASASALVLLLFVIYGHGPVASAPPWVGHLPALNAALNGTSAVLLLFAWRAIRRRALAEHARFMLGALGTSSMFLVSYILYHAVHGETRFLGQGAIRPVYFLVLVSHVVLSAVTLPLVFSSFFFSLSGRFQPHRKVARFTLPLWLYVSVTGVLVFAMLRAFGG